MGTRATLSALLVAILLTACGSGDAPPTVETVQPAQVSPGTLIMLAGQRLDRIATVSIGGQLAPNVTVINAELITAITPAGLAPGPQPLELRAVDGRLVYGAVTVATERPQQASPRPQGTPAPVSPSAATSPPATAPPPTATPPASLAPSPTASPVPSRPPPTATPNDDDDDDDDDDGRERRGPPHTPPGRARGR